MSLNGDGSRAAFASEADGLAETAEDRRYGQVLIRDRTTGALTDVTSGANGTSDQPTLSADGSRVAFVSTATNLAAADTTPDPDVFVKDLPTGTVTLISDPAPEDCPGDFTAPVLSGDGAWVAWVSSKALNANDTNTQFDVYRRAVAAGGAAVLVGAKNGAAGGGTDGTSDPSISDDGSAVAFTSGDIALVSGDTNGQDDVFVRRLTSSTTVIASTVTGGARPGNGDARAAQLSGDGAFVAFRSSSSNLGDGDTDAVYDVHRRSLSAGTTTLVSRANGPSGAKGNGDSRPTGISANGSRVAFTSAAVNLSLDPPVGTGWGQLWPS